MSNIIISPNLFLETQELNQMIKFLSEDGYKRIVKSIVKSYGVVMSNINSDNFRVSVNNTNSIVVNSGVAFDSNLDAIINNSQTVISIPNNNIDNWVKIRHGVSKIETGTISVTNNGTVVGVNTNFTKIFRGQPNYPTKIKLVSTVNTGEYEVVKVIDDNNILISGELQAESNINFSVIGCFTPGFQPSPNNKEIYEYDSSVIEIINNASQPIIEKDLEFLLARVYYDENNLLQIEDIRSNYIFNSEYSNGQYKPMSAPLVSLISWSKNIGGFWTLVLEHGYKIITYQINQNVNGTVITIISGTSNFWQSQTPSINFFAGWRLVNRTNMTSCLIDSNNGRDLVSSDWSNSILTNDNDLVLVPNWNQIEYEITHNPEVSSIKGTVYHTFNINNIVDVMLIPQLSRITNSNNFLRVRYRLIKGSESTPFRNLAIVRYTKNDGTQQLMSQDSTFPVEDTDEGSGGGGGGSGLTVSPSQIILSSAAARVQTLTVSAPDNTWTVDASTVSWLTLTKVNNTTIRAEISENTDEFARYYTIVVKWRDIINTVNVEQIGTSGGGSEFYTIPSILNVSSNGDSNFPITVVSNEGADWDINTVSVSWITVTKADETTANISIEANTDTSSRNYQVVFTSGNLTTILNVLQEGVSSASNISVSPNNINAEGEAYGIDLIVTAPDNTWTVNTPTETWLIVTKVNSTTATVNLTRNETGNIRYSNLVFKWGDETVTVVVAQNFVEPIPELIFEPVRYAFGKQAGSIVVQVTNYVSDEPTILTIPSQDSNYVSATYNGNGRFTVTATPDDGYILFGTISVHMGNQDGLWDYSMGFDIDS
jgi:hypothetical protein